MNETELKPIGKVELAQSADDLDAVFRFRYEVYTEEMGFHFPWSDDAARRLKDRVDAQSLNFFIRNSEGEIVGVIRLHTFSDQNVTKTLAEKYETHHFSETYEGSSRMLIARFLIRKDYRARSKAAWKLILEAYRQCELNNAPLVFIDCSPHLVKFYEALGFRRYAANFTDEVLGYKIPMVILLNDTPYLEKVSSPLFLLARHRADARSMEAWYNAQFPKFGNSVFLQQFDSQELLANVASHAGTLPENFHKVSQKLKSSCLIHVKKGDTVLKQGEMSNEMYLVLKGTLDVLFSNDGKNKQSVTILGPGEVFGELGFLMRSPRTSTVVALEDAELLMIAADKAEQLIEIHPKESAVLFLDLIRLLAQRYVERYQTV
ncbi:MAG TPA: GNAT family N-acetyltransferase [Turneriella sp.]|nr:GNAT family N-acetyltransferase [Turneriella sp.]